MRRRAVTPSRSTAAAAHVVAFDHDADELAAVDAMFRAMDAAGEPPAGATARVVRGDVLALPFPDGAFDKVIAAEVLEHIPDDVRAMAEIARSFVPAAGSPSPCRGGGRSGSAGRCRGNTTTCRVATSGSTAATSSPSGSAPPASRRAAATTPTRCTAPYWWLNCAFGQQSLPSKAWHQVLVWDIIKRPWLTRTAESLLNPVLGKSLVVYVDKPETVAGAASAAA